jgi:hypothetical protein
MIFGLTDELLARSIVLGRRRFSSLINYVQIPCARSTQIMRHPFEDWYDLGGTKTLFFGLRIGVPNRACDEFFAQKPAW